MSRLTLNLRLSVARGVEVGVLRTFARGERRGAWPCFIVRKPGKEKSLADIWPEMGVEERLYAFMEQTRNGTPARYLDALEDIRFYVLEGHPLPTEEEMR